MVTQLIFECLSALTIYTYTGFLFAVHTVPIVHRHHIRMGCMRVGFTITITNIYITRIGQGGSGVVCLMFKQPRISGSGFLFMDDVFALSQTHRERVSRERVSSQYVHEISEVKFTENHMFICKCNLLCTLDNSHVHKHILVLSIEILHTFRLDNDQTQ